MSKNKHIDILIVEDSPTQAARIQYLLEGLNFKVKICEDGHQALRSLSEIKPSIVISDIIMPEMNGFELCERIKSDKRTESIPVILLTSLTDPDEVVEGLWCGADSFITKPFNDEYLVSVIRKLLAEKEEPGQYHKDFMDIEVNYSGKKKTVRTDSGKVIKFLLNIYRGAIHQNNELVKTRDELRFLNERLEDLVEERTDELQKDREKIRAFNEELEERINERTAQLDAANRAKSEFLANMSHEIRTPLNAVLGYAELLGHMVEDKTQKDYIESIKSSGRSLLTLINDILDLSKIEAGKLELQFDYVNSKSFFSEFERIFSLRISEKGLKFILEISSGTPEGILIDDARLRQVILNLLGNAVKFTESGFIKLKVFVENPQIIKYSDQKSEEYIDLIIEVSDSGIGISQEMRERIFDPFIQGERQDIRKYGGTGLGLAITHRLIQLMNGNISLDSSLNEGSTFRIRIPDVSYLRDFNIRSAEVELNPDEVKFNKATIVIADDVEHNRKYLIDTLKKTNLKILEAENGEEAFNLIRKVVPDLVITDIRMPVLDGFGLLEKLKSNSDLKNIPVIAYSASVMKAQRERIRNSEFTGLLIKPVQISELYVELMNNLPYEMLKSDERRSQISVQEPLSEISDLQGLLAELDRLEREEWSKLTLMQPITVVKGFGNQLITAGNTHSAQIISNYGKELIAAADSFNIEAILTLIRKYPVIIDSVKNILKN